MLWKTEAQRAKSRLIYWRFTNLHRGCTDQFVFARLGLRSAVTSTIMALTLTDVRLIASEVARHEDPNLDVVGVTLREGSSSSAEVIFADRACDEEPCRVVIGVSRRLSADECRGAVRAGLQERLARLAT
jgi:hypothetical protein